jgi:hypothetical protein
MRVECQIWTSKHKVAHSSWSEGDQCDIRFGGLRKAACEVGQETLWGVGRQVGLGILGIGKWILKWEDECGFGDRDGNAQMKERCISNLPANPNEAY